MQQKYISLVETIDVRWNIKTKLNVNGFRQPIGFSGLIWKILNTYFTHSGAERSAGAVFVVRAPPCISEVVQSR